MLLGLPLSIFKTYLLVVYNIYLHVAYRHIAMQKLISVISRFLLVCHACIRKVSARIHRLGPLHKAKTLSVSGPVSSCHDINLELENKLISNLEYIIIDIVKPHRQTSSASAVRN